MNEWWHALAQRERILVSGMLAMIVFAMIYWLLLQPLFNGAKDFSQRVATAEENLTWMKRIQPTLQPAGQAAIRQSNESLISIVDRTTQQIGLTPRTNQQAGNDKVRVQFDASSFENMVNWFGLLYKNHGVVVDTVNLSRDNEKAGVVSGTVTIQKANP